jgi:hypothetical protein
MATPPVPAGREAFTLPLALLTVAGAGGMRLLPGGVVRFDPPPLMALLLGTLLVALLVRSRAVDATRLFSPARRPLENASGAVVFVALVAATAQVFHLLTPASGLLNVFVNVLFVALVANTFARRTDRSHLLWSLAVAFGSALALKFVIVDGLATPGGSLARRVFSTAVEGLSLGVLGAEPYAPAMGYVAFIVTALYLVTLWWLPGEEGEGQGRGGLRS